MSNGVVLINGSIIVFTVENIVIISTDNDSNRYSYNHDLSIVSGNVVGEICRTKNTIMKTIIASVLLFAAYATAFKSHQTTNGLVNTFVLVHGAWQAPYAWQRVKQQLEIEGQKVIVIQLPAHGSDNTPPVEASIDSYSQKIVDALKSTEGKVILVGHSMGGMVVSQVAEMIPSKIKKLVYIGAFVPGNGQSLMELSMMDKQSLLGAAIIPSKDQLTLDIKKENLANIFCQDATKDEQEMVLQNYRAEPAIPFTNKVRLTAENFGAADKYYIETAQDHAVGIDLQKQMVKAARISHVYSVNTGHCPFISQPAEVSKLLMGIAKQ